jgi:hypothetical protein
VPHELEELVREELRPAVAELVRRLVPELVAEALNGHAGPAARIALEERATRADATEAPPEGKNPVLDV